MTAKQDAGRALRAYRDDVRAKIARAEQEIVDLRAEEQRIDEALGLLEAQHQQPTSSAAGSERRAGRSGRRRSAQRADRATRVAQITEALKSGPLGVRDLSQRINLTPSRTRALASELRGEGVLTSQRQGTGATAPELFSLPSTDGNRARAQTTRPTRTRRRSRSTPAAAATRS
jgi:DNA-binding transcriptional ArsR family regulator